MAAKHKIVEEYHNEHGDNIVCSCGARVSDYEAHLLDAHKNDKAAEDRKAALDAAKAWNEQ